jgi:spore germination protein KA
MAKSNRRPPRSPASPLEALRRLWRATDPGDQGRPREFSLGGRPAPGSAPSHSGRQRPPDLAANLGENLARLRELLDADHNSDVIFRRFRLALKPPREACLLYVEGLADRTTESEALLQPLMLLAGLNPQAGTSGGALSAVEESLAPAAAISREQTLSGTVEMVLTGMTALLLDGAQEALLVETKGWDQRAVERPQTEQTVRGPQDAFNETLRVNTSLVRRRLRTANLTMESLRVGGLTQTDVVIAYIRGLTNPKLVEEVRRRLRNIELDYAASSGLIEQFIQDRPMSLFPQALATERPDRVSAALSEGYVAILVDTSPYALIVPITFTSALHASEDYYIRWPLGSVARVIRVTAALLTLILPGFYIAALAYHPEMVPTPLLLAIATSRATIPFPLWLEVVIMEFSFQLVREAGIRIPSVIGPTIGIVGALILGQAAVAANLISPIPVVLVSLTALGSFVVPNYQASYTLQVLRFALILCATLGGFYGLALGVFLISLHLCDLTSFGVPFMSPIGPYEPGAGDLVLKAPQFTMELRPRFLRPQKEHRQPEVARQWDRPEGGDD